MTRRKFMALIGLVATLPLPPKAEAKTGPDLTGREYHCDFDTWIRIDGNNWITARCSADCPPIFSSTLLDDSDSYDAYEMRGDDAGRTLHVHYITTSAMEAAADRFCTSVR